MHHKNPHAGRRWFFVFRFVKRLTRQARRNGSQDAGKDSNSLRGDCVDSFLAITGRIVKHAVVFLITPVLESAARIAAGKVLMSGPWSP